MIDNISNLKNIYHTQGWVIIKNFFTKKSVNKIKKQILIKAKRSKSSDHLYFEKIGNKKKLRRIEKVSDFSKISKRMIYTKKIFES